MIELDRLVEVLGLKGITRAGWVRAEIAQPESVADHSHGVAVLALLLLPPELDRERALSFAILHDLPEIRCGDITPHDGISASEKHAREAAALTGLTAGLPRGDEIRALHRAYERQACAESRFVRQLDRLEMALQAVAYARAGHRELAPFVHSALRVIEEPDLRRIAEACLAEIERGEAAGRGAAARLDP